MYIEEGEVTVHAATVLLRCGLCEDYRVCLCHTRHSFRPQDEGGGRAGESVGLYIQLSAVGLLWTGRRRPGCASLKPI